MRKTPSFLKRETIKDIIRKVLKEEKVDLAPLDIKIVENFITQSTETALVFKQSSQCSEEEVRLTRLKSDGFVDGIFTALHGHYKGAYPSLERIKLRDFSVNHRISKSASSIGSDARVSVVFTVEVDRHGLADFYHESRSLIDSCFRAALNSFEFYINCEQTFNKIQVILEDARKRNRADIEERNIYYLTKLTEANTYAR